MKKILKLLSIVAVVAAVLAGIYFVIPDKIINEYKEKYAEEYTITYSYGDEEKTIIVKEEQNYELEEIPQKFGYVFSGLYDAEVGGAQFINGQGKSVSEFKDDKDMVLYPQFSPKEYEVILDYQEANSNAGQVRSMSVFYDSKIMNLPTNLIVEYKTFTGWYTEPNKQGMQLSDKLGMLPIVGDFNAQNFNINDETTNVTIYAGFEDIKHSVTFYYGNNESTEVQVTHNESFIDVAPKTTSDGRSIISWSKVSNDVDGNQTFNGMITHNTILYMAEYGYTITFNSNGGASVESITAKPGTSIELPKPIREHHEFLGWKDSEGQMVNYTTMPESSENLKAEWKALPVINFNSNGGASINSIIAKEGRSITLPTPKRYHYKFLGWLHNGNKVTWTSMPNYNATLEASWEYTDFVSGAGTENDPYVVGSKQDFVNMINKNTGYYELEKNIDLGDWNEYGIAAWENEKDYCPVAFTGNLDGKNYQVSYKVRVGMTNFSSWAFGLFPATRNATIENLKVNVDFSTYDSKNRGEDWDIHNDNCADDAMMGGVIGYAKNTKINNCTVEGRLRYNSVGGNDTCAGGIVGFLSDSEISNCTNKADLYVRGWCICAGGCIGMRFNSTYSNLVSTGELTTYNPWIFGSTYKHNNIIGHNNFDTLKE